MGFGSTRAPALKSGSQAYRLATGARAGAWILRVRKIENSEFIGVFSCSFRVQGLGAQNIHNKECTLIPIV